MHVDNHRGLWYKLPPHSGGIFCQTGLAITPISIFTKYIYFVTYKALKSKNSINTKHDNLSKYMKAKVLKQSCPFYESSEGVSYWNS